MGRTLTIVLLWVGCWRDRDPHVTSKEPKVVPHVSAVCPQALINSYPWAHEVFPGCPPLPFFWLGTTCDGSCPQPCGAVIHDRSSSRTSTERFSYDERGRWASTTSAWDMRASTRSGDTARERAYGDSYCRREGDRATCNVAEQNLHMQATLKYDGKGRVVSMLEDGDETEFEYDDRDHMIAERFGSRVAMTTATYRYDARGRVTSSVEARPRDPGGGTTATYVYDDGTGLLARIAITDTTRRGPVYDHGTTTTTFTYDNQRRPTTITMVDDNRANGSELLFTSTQKYLYDCGAPHPFDEALAVATQFKSRACGCADRGCVAKVGDELEDWREGLPDLTTYSDPDARQGAAFFALGEAIRTCLERQFP